MTLKGHYALSIKRRVSFGAHHENLNEDRLHCQRRRCSSMTLDSGGRRFMRTFAGVPWKGGVKNSGVIENVFFSRFQTLRIWHQEMRPTLLYIVLFSPLSPFHWPQNVTLNDFECLEGPFYVICSLLRTATNYLLLIYCRLFITRVTTEVREAEYSKQWIAERQNIFESTENLRSGVTQGHRKWPHSIACIWFPSYIVTLCLKCTVFEIWRHFGRKSPKNLPHPHLARSFGVTHWEFFDDSYLARN